MIACVCRVTDMNESCINESCDMYGWAMAHVWMSHITCMNEAYHMYARVLSRMCDESRHMYQWVMSCVKISRVVYIDESCYLYESIYMSHGSDCHVYRLVRKKRVSYSVYILVCLDIYDWSGERECHIPYVGWVTSHVSMSHVMCREQSCHIYWWVMLLVGIHIYDPIRV